MKNLRSNWVKKNTLTRLYEIQVPILGLTGGIATGKSTVANLFKDAGVPVIDADKLVKNVYAKKASVEFIQVNFPEAVTNGEIQFKKLREIAFSKPENQQLLENYIYAHLPEAFKNAFMEFKNPSFIVYDVPLLFEKGLDSKVDTTICTYSPRKTQIERLMKRDQISMDLAEKILSRQIDIEEKKNKSDLVIENTGDTSMLKKNFDSLLATLI